MQPLGDSSVNTPAFLGKLWKMVNDPTTDHLICWSPTGNTFVIQNQAQFWYELLPLYYKHNNMSSFVRQLNMYGFHKLSSVENGTMDAEKDEIQFTHPFFQKDQPELLKNIKRKVSVAPKAPSQNSKHDELTRVLSDVKQLRGRQASVDSQLGNIKSENALLWREVAILRQKHIKQQKIVNKLIQFLVTLVQPSRMTVGVKRGYQLMLNESPIKKAKESSNKSTNADGPTIHELDSEMDMSPRMYQNDEVMIESPATSISSHQMEANVATDTTDEEILDVPEFVNIDSIPCDLIADDTLINTLDQVQDTTVDNSDDDKIFLNPTSQDTLLSNLLSPDAPARSREKETPASGLNNMTVATRDKNLRDIIKSLPGTSEVTPDLVKQHVEATQNELEQFKDILNGYNSYVDANALLGLFSDDCFDLNLMGQKSEGGFEPVDPLVSGSELATYNGNFDLNELLEESLDEKPTTPAGLNPSSTLNTPQINKEELTFPSISQKQ